MKIQVFRLNSSSYQDKDFIKSEAKLLSAIEGVEYITSASALSKDAKYVLISNTHTDLSKLAKNLLENTILMLHPNSGHDNIPASFVRDVDFPILRGNKIRAQAVAEYILSCMFRHFTQIKNHLFWDQSRVWNRKRLRDQKTLILGFGHVGKLVYKSLSPLVKDLTVIDPQVESNELIPQVKTQYDDECFKNVDVLILATSLNESTKGLINQKVFEQVSESVLIINPSRGKVIAQKDLEKFLEINPNAFAYLDVFTTEPFSSSDFKSIKNVNKTSHIAGVYKELNRDIIEFEKEALGDFLKDQGSFNEKYSKDIL